LFTARQQASLLELGEFVRGLEGREKDVIRALVAMCIDKVAMQNSCGCRWKATGESLMDTFGRQALPMVWDFAESSPISGSTGDFRAQAEWLAKVIAGQPFKNFAGVQAADAANHPLPDETCAVWFTDPPYYDAVPYAHLSDFFFVWLKRALHGYPLLGPANSRGGTTPKGNEIVVDRPHRLSTSIKDPHFYERGMVKAFAEGRRVLQNDGIGSVVFAHKTTEGWEALLSGMIEGGWTITGSWPVATEMGSRLNARQTASLATSVHLVCRPRPDDAPVGDWADVLRELPRRVSSWIERLQNEGIRGADLVFACVGPALEIFSRYRAVETADGHEVELPEYLEKVWEVVGRAALQRVLGTVEAQSQNGLGGALEEDARLTALFLWTLQSTETSDGSADTEKENEEAIAKIAAKGFSLPFDVVRRFAQPMGIDLGIWTGRIVRQEKGVVRLMPVADRASDLFGEDGASAAADWIESDSAVGVQAVLFPELDLKPKGGNRRVRGTLLDGDAELQRIDATTLDRVHAAMLFQASGHASALRTLIGAEQDRGPDFLRLANALSALYPRGSQEKRHIDAMLLAVPR
jgi:hypothetical protein